MLQMYFFISNKCCSFELSIHHRIRIFFFYIDDIKKCFLNPNLAYQNDFWWCDIVDWSNDYWKFSFAIKIIHWILKYIQIENRYLNWYNISQHYYTVFLSNKCSHSYPNNFFQKHLNKILPTPNFWMVEYICEPYFIYTSVSI